ncbi:purine hydroxylase delta subunit apoprotein [Bradyrhizobium erythrophlei]|jgi:carbon-monoxide dehydrogenase small subunit|nr:purine hydroxylase delta subunit apoprotein [Bradyrhizobium erythrophlei]
MTDGTRAIKAIVNGEAVEAVVPIRMLLVDFLRERLQLTGTHVGCTFEGVCGACTVRLDGKAVKSCMLLAAQIDGRQVTTVEGLARGDEPHPLQKAFRDAHALQCGYCTPGILMNMSEFLERNPDPSESEIRVALVGNICRCTGYSHIVEAVKDAATNMKPVQGRVA